MKFKRYYASSVLDNKGNMLIMGGTAANKQSDSTEVYEYLPRGQGHWEKGLPLPGDYRDTGIESHCTVR